MERGLTVGHEPVGVIERLGSAVKGCREGQTNGRGVDVSSEALGIQATFEACLRVLRLHQASSSVPSVKRNVAPCAAAEVAQTRPPCRSITHLTTLRPRPCPG